MLSLWIVADCLFSIMLYGYVSALKVAFNLSEKEGNIGDVISS